MPQVASDPVVQRPLRPEPPTRAGASSGEQSGSFEVLLDNGPATPPPTERPERVTRSRSTDRTDQTRANDRSQPRTDTRRSRNAGEPTSKSSNPAKPADTPNAKQAKSGQPSDTSQPVADTAVAAAEATPAPVVDLTAIVASVTVDASGDGKPETADTGKPAATTDEVTGGSKDTDTVAADTKTTDVAAAVIVAVAAPVPAPAVPATIDPTADPAAVAPVAIQAAAPAMPADAATPDAPVLPATTPGIANPADAAPAKPQTAADAATADKTAPSDDSQKGAALKAVGLGETIETPDAKSPAPADRKADSGKAKTDHPGSIVRTADAQPHPDAAKPATADTDQSPKVTPHQPHEPIAEHAPTAPRAAATDTRPELPATAAAPAQLNAGAPAVPFNLVAPLTTPLAAMPPLVALHVDPASDNAVPVAGLAVEIVSRAQDGLKRFDIRLDPPELGRIDVRLDVDSGGKVTSRLVVERADTLDLLRRDAPQLERALQHAGLNTEGGLEFSLRDQNFANREQTPRDLPTTHLIVPDDEPAATEAARRGYGRLIGLGGGVDIRV